ISERGKKFEGSRKEASAVEEVDQLLSSGLDEVIAYRRCDNSAGINQELGTGRAGEVLFADRIEAVAIGTGRHTEQPAVVFIRPPRQQRRVFRQELPQTCDVIVMYESAGFGYGPLESSAEA